MGNLPQWLATPIDNIDAAIFSGDTFVGDDEAAIKRRAEMRATLERWTRQLNTETMMTAAAPSVSNIFNIEPTTDTKMLDAICTLVGFEPPEGVWTVNDRAEFNAVHDRRIELERKRVAVLQKMREDIDKLIFAKAKYHNMSLANIVTFIFEHRKTIRDILNRDQT